MQTDINQTQGFDQPTQGYQSMTEGLDIDSSSMIESVRPMWSSAVSFVRRRPIESVITLGLLGVIVAQAFRTYGRSPSFATKTAGKATRKSSKRASVSV
jgi:hypothetical protein